MSSSLPSLIDLFINRVKRPAKTICESLIKQAQQSHRHSLLIQTWMDLDQLLALLGRFCPQLEQASG